MTRSVPAIPVCYDERLCADSASFSPSAGKPRPVFAAWRTAGLPLAQRPVTPASEAELALAHDPAYVRAVLAGRAANGFGNHSTGVAQSLPYTTGALIDATRAAREFGCACAPVSGFHHAHHDHGGGFCTFNGLVVAARRAPADGGVRRVLILDCDMHFGDGTEAILERLALGDSIVNCTFGRWFDSAADAPRYLARLRQVATTFGEFDLILYQAGADLHVDDPLGGVLTTPQLAERDRVVFEAAHAAGVPLAWNLAGGYQEPLSRVIDLHTQTMQECARVFAGAPGTASLSARRMS